MQVPDVSHFFAESDRMQYDFSRGPFLRESWYGATGLFTAELDRSGKRMLSHDCQENNHLIRAWKLSKYEKLGRTTSLS